MLWVVGSLVIFALVWYFFTRLGKLSFWKLAAKFPEVAYEHFQSEECWFIDEVPTHISKSDVVGPFKLFVPQLNRFVSIYGIADQIEGSEEKFRKSIL